MAADTTTASDVSDVSPVQGAIPLYELEKVGKEYTGPGENVVILQGITLSMARGDTIAVVGASGSGKSSLLHLLGTLATPSWGDIRFCGRRIESLSEEEKARLRNREMGFVFQFHHLLPEFSTVENVAMQAVISGESRASAMRRARAVLEEVGLEHRADFAVGLLSGGERQRAAIARAVLCRPKVLLADEPTGNLDEANGRRVTDLLVDLNKQRGMSLVVVTHNPELAARMDRCFELKSGELYEQTR